MFLKVLSNLTYRQPRHLGHHLGHQGPPQAAHHPQGTPHGAGNNCNIYYNLFILL